MIRYIKIEDENNRDAEITFKSVSKKSSIYLALENGEKPKNKKVIKSSKEYSIDNLISKENPTQEDYNAHSEVL